MKYEVPQPTIAVRSPGAGSAPRCPAACDAARVQHSGWLVSSSSTWLMPGPPLVGSRSVPMDGRSTVVCLFLQDTAFFRAVSSIGPLWGALGSPGDRGTEGGHVAGRPLEDAAGAARRARPAGRRGGGRRAGGVLRDDPARLRPARRAADAGAHPGRRGRARRVVRAAAALQDRPAPLREAADREG